MKDSTSDILEKYSKKLESRLGEPPKKQDYSREYKQFREEMIPQLTKYERWANSLGNLIRINISKKDKVKIGSYLRKAHLSVTPEQATTLSILSMLGIFFATILISVAVFLINYPGGFVTISNADLSNFVLFILLGVFASMFTFYYTYTLPRRLANVWKLKASSQMVPAVLYVVVYMKHTSNLERAIEFAAQNLQGPLALDMKKIFYDVEIGKFSTIKQSLENYLEEWRDYSPEFVESFHLIESSLFEPSESRRIEILEKALEVILEGVYEKMLKYSREIRSPLTNIYMLGIILPTLGLALLPLASTLLGGIIRWPQVFVLFNVLVPFLVFYLVTQVLLKRPGGYGESSSIELNPGYEKFSSRKPWFFATLILIPFLILGFLPFILQVGFVTNTLGIGSDWTFNEIGLGFLGETKLFDFKVQGDDTTGPFGPAAIFLSLFIPLGLTLFFSYAYSKKTKHLIKSRHETKELEREFAGSLFQLGNRLGDGVPAEVAFGDIARTTQGQKTSSFFSLVNQNVRQFGMSLEQAIFNKKRGAIIHYPSELISTTMRILVESIHKGLKIAARSLMSISQYVKNIEKINRRLKDLLAEIVSDMKSNMTFLAPLLAGVVVGLSAMIATILNRLQTLQVEGGAEALGGLGNFSDIASIFEVSQMIPPYFIQLSIGIYIIEIIFILTGTLVSVNSGKDSLQEKYELARNLKRGTILYVATALVSTLALTLLASVVI